MKLGIGLIGCGGMGRALAGVIRDRVPDAVIVAGYDPFSGAREEFTRGIGAPGTESLAELLAREDIGGVIIATPNDLHCEQTVAAAAAGKHVFCEKPMALSVADCNRMIGACDAAGVKLMVGQSTRLAPVMRRLREVVGSGELGEPVYGYASYFFGGFKARASGMWHANRGRSGGVLFHMGIHQVDLFHALFGPSRRVHYAGGRYGLQGLDFDDVASVLIEYHSGATAVISVAGMCPVPAREVVLALSRGYARLGNHYRFLEFGQSEGSLTRLAANELPGPDELETELGSFVSWILRGDSPVLTGVEGRAAVAVAEAAERARQTGAPAEV